VNPSLIEVLWASGYLPVISPITSDGKGQLLNCNADELAGSFSRALGADALFLLSDIDQIRLDVLDAATGLAKITFDDLEAMVNDGRASGGMIPKAKAAIAAGRQGAARVVIANAATKNILTKALANQALTTEVIA
jgi:acetylglutamate kinase